MMLREICTESSLFDLTTSPYKYYKVIDENDYII
jgi:hypothetical protein